MKTITGLYQAFYHDKIGQAAAEKYVHPYSILYENNSSASTTHTGFKNNPFKESAVILIIFLVYFLSGKLGLTLAFENASATAVWAPTGIALAAFLLRGYHVWPAIFAGAFLINVTTTGNIPTSLLIAAGNTSEGLLGAYLVNRFAGGKYAFDSTVNIMRFVLYAGILSTAISATAGVTSLAIWGFVTWSSYVAVWLTWWIGDAVGAFLLVPFLILWFERKKLSINSKLAAEAAAVFLFLAVTTIITFTPFSAAATENYPLNYILIPPFVWIGFRFDKRFVSTAAFMVCGIAIWGTLQGNGPFVVESQNDSLLFLQSFICIITVMSLIFSSVVEERYETRDRLKESGEELKNFIDNASVGIHLVTEEGRIIWANKQELEMLGYSLDEYVGRNVSEFHADQDKFNAIFSKLTKNETVHNFDAQLRCKDGTIRDVLVSSNVYLKNGKFIHTRCFTRDVTEKKRLEHEVRQREQELYETEKRKWESFYRLLEKLPAGAYTCDKEGLITYYNEQAAKLWGRQPKLNDTADRYCGAHRLYINTREIKHEESWMALALKNKMGYNGEEIVIESPEGAKMEVLAHANPVYDKSGELIGAVNVLVDISEQKKTLKKLEEAYGLMEEKVIERTEALRKAQSELIHSEKLASLGRFSAGIAHEIRNPLANISSLAQLLIRKNKDKGAEKHLRHIHANSIIANNIIKDLLNIASPHNVNFKEADVISIINNVCNCVEGRCEKNNIKLVKNLSGDIPFLMLNISKVEAALLNLISNAIEAMPGGGVLQVSAMPDAEKNEVIISVEDNGCGISAENIDKVLEPFFTTKHEGTGLGLSLVYHVIKAHSGEVFFKSRVNRGTVFNIILPVKNV